MNVLNICILSKSLLAVMTVQQYGFPRYPSGSNPLSIILTCDNIKTDIASYILRIISFANITLSSYQEIVTKIILVN